MSEEATVPADPAVYPPGVPSHWRIVELGRIGSIFKGSGGTKDDEVEDGLPCIRYGDIYTQYQYFARETRSCLAEDRQAKYTAIRHGDILFAASGETLDEIGKSVANLMRGAACCGGDIIVLRPSCETDPRFMGYAAGSSLAQAQKSRMGRGMTVMHIYGSDLKRLRVALPPLDEQTLMADFLDRETEKIDALIAKKRRLIELLDERRLSMIGHAVTRGLDPDAPMKDSGVEWLGKVPDHWTTAPLKHLVDPFRPVMYGIVLPGPDFDGGVPIVKGGDVAEERLVWAMLKRTDPEIERRHVRSRLKGDDIVYAIRGSIGATAMIPAALEGANLTQDVARVAPGAGTDPQWLKYALQSAPVFAQLEAGAVGATIRGINIFSLKRAVLPVPPANEQIAIREFLNRENERLDRLLRNVRCAVERLDEYRSALITAAVTGQLDVRDKELVS